MPLSLNGVSAWVEVDGKELEQYGVEHNPEHNEVTCWIATEVNKDFSVVFRDDSTYREHSLCSELQLDGSSVGGKVLRPSTGLPVIPQDFIAPRTVVHGAEVLSPTSSRPFLFSKVELTEEDEYLGQGSVHLGEIHIRIYRATSFGAVPLRAIVGASSHAKVHERGKKAVTHCVSYGQERRTTTQYSSCLVKYLDGRVPLVTFVFKYRDLGLLQANGIIPKPPPVRKKPVVSDEVLDLTVGNNIKPEAIDEEIEIVEATTQSRKRKATLTKGSSSGCQSVTKPAKKIKREKELVFTGEVIDLT